tara:strand:+ start:97 stop:930 length:834 start_codon:yes stop_codon:yes gene_type:complete
MKIIILTGSDLRHTFFRKVISFNPNIETLQSFCEDHAGKIDNLITNLNEENIQRINHLKSRKVSEIDFFGLIDKIIPDHSNPLIIQRGTINDEKYLKQIISLKPDLIICYGCSIIKEDLLNSFENKILNLHLGLSPYFRGSGTNFWPLYYNIPEYIGATFMFMDDGIDTGEIIHQIRPTIFENDSPHQIGNRLILKATLTFIEIIEKFNLLKKNKIKVNTSNLRKYKRKIDFTEKSVIKMKQNLKNGMLKQFLNNKDSRLIKAPIIENSVINNKIKY